MLPLSFIRQEKQRIVASLAKRQITNSQIVDDIIAADDLRKSLQTVLDNSLSEANRLAKEIGALIRQNKPEEAAAAKEKATQLREDAKNQQAELKTAEENLLQLSLQLPNCLADIVPSGRDADDNEIFKNWNTPFPVLLPEALPHWELAKKYQLFDFELGVKITGAGFPLYSGKGAKLQRALISFFLDKAIEAGYLEYIPPLMVNKNSATATGQLPDKDAQMYYVERDEFYRSEERRVGKEC